MPRINFDGINQAALAAGLATVLARWLPNGQVRGREFIALNPRRHDRRPGSFRISCDTGKWSDFATGDRGADVVSYIAYITNTSQATAARHLAETLNIPAEV